MTHAVQLSNVYEHVYSANKHQNVYGNTMFWVPLIQDICLFHSCVSFYFLSSIATWMFYVLICVYLLFSAFMRNNAHTHLTALCLGLPKWAGTRKVKPIWILLKQETVSGSGISRAICKSAPRSRQITTPAPHRFFTGRMPFVPPNQQRQSTEGRWYA